MAVPLARLRELRLAVRSGMSSIPLASRHRPPGLLTAVCTGLLSLGIVFAAIDWWPGAGHRVDELTNLLILLVLGVLLLVAGIVWAVKTFGIVCRDRRWSWWILPAPSIVVVALVIALLVPKPSFQSSREDFEMAVRNPPNTSEPISDSDVHVGPFTMSRITWYPAGTVYFYHADQVRFRSIGGWVYSPDGPPVGDKYYEKFEVTHIDGPWYEFLGRQPNW